VSFAARRTDQDRVEDLRGFAAAAAAIVSRGRAAFDDDGPDGYISRLAANALILHTAEAAEKMSPEFIAAHSEVPWVQIRGMRNHVAHDYPGVVTDFVWNTLERRYPELMTQLGTTAAAFPITPLGPDAPDWPDAATAANKSHHAAGTPQPPL
jgi:hypothetical protein